MLNFNRKDSPPQGKESDKTLRPAIYEPPSTPARPAAPAAPVAARPATLDVPLAPPREPVHTATAPASAPVPASAADTPGSKLFVGVNIQLKGVEISDCDVLVIEGHVEATVNSKAMEIAKPGTLSGTAVIDFAEIHGHFSGELTARTRLVVHGTGRVSGTVRYGKLIVDEGGEISGDIKRLDAAGEAQPAAKTPAPEARPALSPSTERWSN
jgi:cytoskeletal protein CcmA (bactofilin family)